MSTNVTWANGVTYSIPASGEVNWPSLSTFLIALGNTAAIETVMKQSVRVALTTPVTVSNSSDCAVLSNLTVAGAVAVTLPAGVDGRFFIIGDQKGDAATNNITITPNGAETINGSATYVINDTRGSVILAYSTTNTRWNVVARFSGGSTLATPTVAGVVTSYFPTVQGSVSTTTNASLTATTTDGFAEYRFSTGGTTRTLTLPAASTNGGRIIKVVKTDNGTGNLNITRAGADTINGATTYTLRSQYGHVELVSDGGTSWSLYGPAYGRVDASDVESGLVGQYLSPLNTGSSSTPGTNVSSTANTSVASLTLTPGVWLINGVMTAGPGSLSDSQLWISTAANATTGRIYGDNYHELTVTSSTHTVSVPGYIVNINASVTYYLTVAITFGGGGTISVAGRISATRIA